MGVREIVPQAWGIGLIHGTTVGTNALLEGRTGKTALITTKGFEDILEIGRQTRPELYNLWVEKARPLIPAHLRFGIGERTSVKGELLKRPLKREVESILERVKRNRVEALAICLLNSFANPANERFIAHLASRLGLPVSASHQVLSEFREYERFSTTAVNAALIPIMGRYLEGLETSLHSSNIRIMQSNGGSISSRLARLFPVRTIFSGPAGGVVGAREVARMAGFDKIITFDMGGTSTDVSLVDGDIRVVNETSVAQIPIKMPVIDIHSVGAGGGSIAYIDPGGALRVGPMSAGADPGPICYSRGRDITVTDAHLFLGRIVPAYFLGGRMRLYKERVAPHISRLAKAMRTTPERAALGIIEVADAAMEKAIRVISVERGHDPRDFTLVCFGGAGGLHACHLAERLSIPQILIPREPGTLSALGMLLSDVIRDYSATVLMDLSRIDGQGIKKLLSPLIDMALEDMTKEGLPRGRLAFYPSADLRYKGQSYELNLPLSLEDMGIKAEDFHKLHERSYGYYHPGRECELVNLRLRVVGKVDKPQLERARVRRSPKPVPISRHRVYLKDRWAALPIFSRDQLAPGSRFSGPALVVEYSATHFIPPGFKVDVDPRGNLLIRVRSVPRLG